MNVISYKLSASHRLVLLQASRSALQDLTVKELRQRVKDLDTSERGTLSRLKRKQDLIDYLVKQQQQQQQQVNGDSSTANGQDSKTAAVQPQRRRRPPPVVTQMPLLDDTASISTPKTNGAVSPLTLKEAAFERVYQRYPVLRQAAAESPDQNNKDNHKNEDNSIDNNTNDNNSDPYVHDDLRQWQHPIFTGPHNVTTDMDVVFVGTASCTPGVTRGVSCTALRLHWRRQTAMWNAQLGRLERPGSGSEGGGNTFQGGTWLFDVGECTQLQVQRTASVRPSKITKIFLTHAHGDHTFGLPGLLCLMGQDYNRDGNVPPIEIYGPEGLRMWLRVAIRYSVSRIVPPYRVHELMDLPMAPEWEFSSRARRFFYRRHGGSPHKEWGGQGLAGQDPTSWISQANSMPLEASHLYGEIEGGRSIYPQYNHPLSSDGAPVYEVEDEQDVQVYAAPMSHGIPCVGYVVKELPRPGRLRNEVVEPIVKRNLDALRQAGFKIPMKAMAVIKNLPPGASFSFPDGTVLTQEDAVEPQRQGRKVVICGDTCDSRALRKLAQDADLVIHEATNAYLEGLDSKDTDMRSVERDAVVHGHSTPTIAARFARSVNAQRLAINHFSARYKGDPSVESLSIMQRIEEQAIHQVPGWNETHVVAAWDLMVLPVPQR